MYEERDTWNIRMEKLEHMEGSGEFRTEWSVDSFMYVRIYIYTRIWRQLGQNVVRSIGNNFWESLSDWLFILLTLIQSLIVRYYRFKFLFCSVPFPPLLICGKKFFSEIENRNNGREHLMYPREFLLKMNKYKFESILFFFFGNRLISIFLKLLISQESENYVLK